MHLAWRHVYPGNLRDIAFTTLMAAGVTGTPVRVSEDRWMLQGCPDDGPAMDVDGSGRVHVVWPTVVTNDGAGQKVLFHASSADGRTFTARTRVPVEGQANHPQIAVARDGTLVLAWDEVHGTERRIVVATSSGAGLSAAPVFRRDRIHRRPVGRLSGDRAHADTFDRRVDERSAGGIDDSRASSACCSLGTGPGDHGILRRSK